LRKLKIIEHISLDGIIQTSSEPDDDFRYGDWTAPYRSPAGLQTVLELYGESCDMLLGRRTYDMFASYWPKAPNSPMGDRLNTGTKYVVTHRPENLQWRPVEALTGDFADSVRRIKAMPGPDIVLAGSASLIAPLLEHGLADEIVMLVNPVVVGKGKRFFEDGSLPRAFAFGSSRAMPSGILVNIYKLIPTLAEEALSRARLEREIEIAREVQQRLFPQTFPTIPGIDIAAHCRPAHAVGGDYYDLISIADSISIAQNSSVENNTARLGIAIGDISGKGISASLLMASLHASLRSQTLSGSGDLSLKMANINRLLYDASGSNRYATFFYAELDPATRTLYYCNGGHNPPAILRQQGDTWHTFRLEDGGPAIGLLPAAPYQQQTFHMQPGDTLLAFTDGISEAMNPREQEWGEDSLIAEAQANTHLTATQLLQHLYRAADTFANNAPQHDDMTLVILKLSA